MFADRMKALDSAPAMDEVFVIEQDEIDIELAEKALKKGKFINLGELEKELDLIEKGKVNGYAIII